MSPNDKIQRQILPIPDQTHWADNHEHLISPEERLRVAMARQ